jgi:CoA transferase family III
MGKRGLCVNLRDPRGLKLVHELVKISDVFVENYRPSLCENALVANARKLPTLRRRLSSERQREAIRRR